MKPLYLVVASFSALLGLVLGLVVAPREEITYEPHCYEDQVAYRAEVPGGWHCVAIDQFLMEDE